MLGGSLGGGRVGPFLLVLLFVVDGGSWLILVDRMLMVLRTAMLGFWTCSMSWRTLGPCVATLHDSLELTVSHIVNMRIIPDGTMRHSSWYSPNHVGS